MIHRPFRLVARVIAADFAGYRHELPEMYADGAYGVATAMASWDPDGGRSETSWAWLHARAKIREGILRRARWSIPVTLDGDAGWTEPTVIDPGYAQAEDRVVLQRWADIAWLTDGEADALAWGATHMGTQASHLPGGRSAWFSEDERIGSAWRRGIDKLRVAADRERRIHERRATP